MPFSSVETISNFNSEDLSPDRIKPKSNKSTAAYNPRFFVISI